MKMDRESGNHGKNNLAEWWIGSQTAENLDHCQERGNGSKKSNCKERGRGTETQKISARKTEICIQRNTPLFLTSKYRFNLMPQYPPEN